VAENGLFDLGIETRNVLPHTQIQWYEHNSVPRTHLLNNYDVNYNNNDDRVFFITFAANGGTGTMAAQMARVGRDITLNANAFTRTSYAFVEWNTASDGAGTDFSNAHVFEPWVLNDDMTLYAQWTPSPTATVGTQQSPLTAGQAGTTTFPVTTTNIPDGTYDITVSGLPNGITAQAQITIDNGSSILTLAGDTSILAGDSILILTIHTVPHATVSNDFNLIIDALPDRFRLEINDIFLDVNDIYNLPNRSAIDNTKTFTQIEYLLNATGTNIDAAPPNAVNNFTLSAPTFSDIVSFDSVTAILNTDGSVTALTAPFEVPVRADWTATGQYDIQTLRVHIVDRVAPVITVGHPIIYFYTNNAPDSMDDILTAAGVTVTDNYDSAVTPQKTFLGTNVTFNTIDWTLPFEWVLYLDTADSSGNEADQEMVRIRVQQAPPEGGTNLPEPPGGGDSDEDTTETPPPPTLPTQPTNPTTPTSPTTPDEDDEEPIVQEPQEPQEPPTLPGNPPPPPTVPATPESTPTPGGTIPDIPPTPTDPTNTLMQYGDMWIELDENGVPLGAWIWDEPTDMWIFDENVPLGAFAPDAAVSVAGLASLMPQTGLSSFSTMFGLLFIFVAVLAAGTWMLIKRESKKQA